MKKIAVNVPVLIDSVEQARAVMDQLSKALDMYNHPETRRDILATISAIRTAMTELDDDN
jgi:hypothetical protein